MDTNNSNNKQFTFEYTHKSGPNDIYKFTVTSNDLEDVFNNHVSFLKLFSEHSRKHKRRYSKKEQEELK
jgi:hypothetical protein